MYIYIPRRLLPPLSVAPTFRPVRRVCPVLASSPSSLYIFGFLAISESEGTKNGARPVTDMLLDGTHIRVQRNRKAIREGGDRGDDRMGGNCVESAGPLTSKVFFLDSESNERLPPYPGLLIPPLPAPERYDLSHHLHVVVRPRSAHAARC